MPAILDETRCSTREQERNLSLLSQEDNVGIKLAREAYVFGIGTLTGAGAGIADKLENPVETIAEGGLAFSVGYALGLLQRRVPGLKILGAAMTYAMIKDIAVRSESLGGVWCDTWRSAEHVAQNKQVVGSTLGKFLVDTAFTTAVGGAGAHFGAARGLQTELYKNLRQKNFDNNSVGTIRVCTSTGGVSYGTAFALDEHRLVTCNHVVGKGPNYGISAYSARSHTERAAKVLIQDPVTDLAILETKVPHGIKPLKLAESLPPVDSKVIAIGTLREGTGYRTFLPREGLFKGVRPEAEILSERIAAQTIRERAELHIQQFWRSLIGFKGSKGDPSQVWSWGTPRLRNGMSGGPLLDATTLEVIGVNSFGIRNLISGFSSVSELKGLMTQVGVKKGL